MKQSLRFRFHKLFSIRRYLIEKEKDKEKKRFGKGKKQAKDKNC
jgi:hypothetical protein